MFVQKQCKRDLNGEFDEISAIVVVVVIVVVIVVVVVVVEVVVVVVVVVVEVVVVVSSSSSSSRSKCSTERPNELFLEPLVPETCKNVFVPKQCKRDLKESLMKFQQL